MARQGGAGTGAHGGGTGSPDTTPTGTPGSHGLPDGTLFVDPGGMRGAAALFDNLDTHARNSYYAFRYATEQLGECWGNDSTGQTFAQTYGPAYQDSLQGAWSVADGFSTIGDNVREWAGSYETLWAASDAAASQVWTSTEEALGIVSPAGNPPTDKGAPAPTRAGGG